MYGNIQSMVRFFNQKEEVISLELTPYGKKKFSDGEFMPAFYAFYDSDILYDGVYGNLYEEQNNIVTRISGPMDLTALMF